MMPKQKKQNQQQLRPPQQPPLPEREKTGDEEDESPIRPPSLLGPCPMANGKPGDSKSALHRGPPGSRGLMIPPLLIGQAQSRKASAPGLAHMVVVDEWSMLNPLFRGQAMGSLQGKLSQRAEKPSKAQKLVSYQEYLRKAPGYGRQIRPPCLLTLFQKGPL
ncbi:Proline-rich protein 3 [Sciurus carolinensis]|uniref:Proline-rich protein 3 n=1 Tax=Sciurus carolinensis TaxID=30640 RepID=A0AA41MSU5_SCICA|nr:Proline-rich protein 3 [Sciurus carolinensis]